MMNNQKRCPACGTLLPEKAAKCTACKLDGLNMRFLSKAGYEKWVKEVLEPHKAAIAPKVFAGAKHGLILTSRGDLYGLGNNQNRQLADTEQECYEQPVLIARDVVSAAACGAYTAYVKQDGAVCWQCADSENLPQFDGIRAVYGESWHNRFWAVKHSGEVLCFGNNYDGLLAQRRKQIACQLPETTRTSRFSTYGDAHWSDDDSTDWLCSAQEHFQKSEAYQEMVALHGEQNVELDENEVPPGKALKALYFTFQKEIRVYRPVIYTINNFLFDPIPFEKKWREDLPHRVYGRPVLAEEYIRGSWEENPEIKQVSQDDELKLTLLEDGSVIAGKTKLDWLQQPIGDIARGSYIVLLSCRNGDILWCDGELFGESEWKKMTDGQMNRCCLPENP